MVDIDKPFQPILALDTTRRLWICGVGTFDDMKDNHGGVVHDCFSGRKRGISSLDWNLHFCMWIKEKRQRLSSFND